MGSFESVLFWLTTLGLAVAFFLSLLSTIFKKAGVFAWGNHISLTAFALLTVFVVTRWIGSAHPPFVTLFESMTAAVWFALLIFLIVRLRTSQAMILIPVSLVTFLLMGWASSLPSKITPLSDSLDSVWLFIHATFATAGAAAFVIAASFSIIYIMGEDRVTRMATAVADRLPEFARIPRRIQNFVIFGLILWGVMIVSGSIWAHAAWGRYWAWDPIELWSLISWLMYGLLLHARMTFKMSIRLFCWLTVICALAVVFALWGVGYVYDTIHVYG